MPPVQTSYSETQNAAIAGLIANSEQAVIISRTVEAAAGIAFGLAVKQGTEDNEVDAWDGSGTFKGITCRERSVNPDTPNLVAQYESTRVMTKGPVWVMASVAVDAGDPVYVTDAGAFTNSASGNTEIVGAEWDSSTTGAALARVRLG